MFIVFTLIWYAIVYIPFSMFHPCNNSLLDFILPLGLRAPVFAFRSKIGAHEMFQSL